MRPVLMVFAGNGASLSASCDVTGDFEVVMPAQGDFVVHTAVVDTNGQRCSPNRSLGDGVAGQPEFFPVDGGATLTGLTQDGGGIDVSLLNDPAMTGVTIDAVDEAGLPLAGWSLWDGSPDLVQVANVAPGTYRLRFTSNGLCVPTFHGGVTDVADATTVEVRAGEVISLTTELVRGGRISGRVIMPEGGPPTADFELALFAAGSLASPLMTYRSWSSGYHGFFYDADTGEFEIRRMEDGAYLLQISIDAETWSWYPGVANWSEAVPVVIEGGSEVDLVAWQL